MILRKTIQSQWEAFLLIFVLTTIILCLSFRGSVTSLTEEMRITALGEKGANSSTEEIHLRSYTINGVQHGIADTPNVITSGSWRWYGSDGRLYSWLPESNSNRTDNMTSSITLQLPLGEKSLDFLMDSYCGRVSIEYNGKFQTVDTSVNGHIELGGSPVGQSLMNSLRYIGFYTILLLAAVLVAALFVCLINVLFHRTAPKFRAKFVRAVVFVILFSLVAYPLQLILNAKYSEDGMHNIDGFYAEKEHNLDVVFLGASAMFCSIDPMILYNEYGIGSYDFGSSSQDLYITYLFVQEMFKTQKPKLVVVECGQAFNEPGEVNEVGMRMGLTAIKFSTDKLACIYRSTGGINSEFMSYVFPILKFKTRWKELGEYDFTYPFEGNKICETKGYLQTDAVTSDTVDLTIAVGEAEKIPENNVIMLKKIIELCKRNGAKLLLMKTPVPVWSYMKSKAIEEFAAPFGIPVIDYITNMDGLKLDPTTDFRNMGHVNDSGAGKITRNLGQYLIVNYDLPDRRKDVDENTWDASLKKLAAN